MAWNCIQTWRSKKKRKWFADETRTIDESEVMSAREKFQKLTIYHTIDNLSTCLQKRIDA